MQENTQTTRLNNGLTIITDQMPDIRSATIGFWFKVGSRHEPAHLNGICHFIEHAVFKGTAVRSALDIAIESDKLGGNLNAFTSHEETAFLIKVVDKKIPEAFDLIADMLANPRFDEKDLSCERKVIIEEIKMVEDSPEDLLTELFLKDHFPKHALGLPIEGTPRTVRTFKNDVVREFHAENYKPDNLVIACAGNVAHEEIVGLSKKYFNLNTIQDPKSATQNPISSAKILLKNKGHLEQTHLIIAFPWINARDERRYAASLLVSILGDGNSSRLWQNIREERGLAYSVGAGSDSFADCGIFSVFAGTSPENLSAVIDLSIGEIRRLRREGVAPRELELAKEQTVASVLLGLESTAARAEALAHSEMTHGRQIPLAETLRRIEAVEAEDLQSLASEFFRTELAALAALGNLNGIRVSRSRLKVS